MVLSVFVSAVSRHSLWLHGTDSMKGPCSSASPRTYSGSPHQSRLPASVFLLRPDTPTYRINLICRDRKVAILAPRL